MPESHVLSKDPGPEDPALVHPWKGVLGDLADFNLVLECWSTGVLDRRRPDKHPLGVEPGANFDVDRYRWIVYGHYNQIGALMTDIAQLSRIMVPYDVSLTHASAQEQAAYADTTGAMVRAQFLLRTFVKPQAVLETGGGEGGDR